MVRASCRHRRRASKLVGSRAPTDSSNATLRGWTPDSCSLETYQTLRGTLLLQQKANVKDSFCIMIACVLAGESSVTENRLQNDSLAIMKSNLEDWRQRSSAREAA